MSRQKLHGRGRITKSPATPDSVSERARELSLIGGHYPNRPTRANLQQARKEMVGDDSGDAAADDPNIAAQRLDKRPFSTGTKVRTKLPKDDQTTERTVQEGIDEAEHDEMVAASKTKTRSEG